MSKLPSRTGVAPVAKPARNTETGAGVGGWADSLLQEVLAATYWFDPGEVGKPYSASVRFSGRRIEVIGKSQPRDSFTREETIAGVVPGSGAVSITTRVSGINLGEWLISAEPVRRKGSAVLVRSYPWSNHGGPRSVKPALWYWRTPAIASGPASPVKTRLAPLVSTPGAHPLAWPALVGLGVLVGLAAQAMIVARAHLEVDLALAVSISAIASGVIGAKAWFLILHRRSWRAFLTEGSCIQGFILGAAVAGTAALALLGLPVGTFLDSVSPGLFFGMAIGRHGCFFAGCCTGRPTASRWGLWASDRRVGTRRIPTQLLEALACLIIGSAALILLLQTRPPVPGALFVGALAAYTLFRQFTLPLRAEGRNTSIGRPLTVGASVLVLIADFLWSTVA